MNNPAEMAIVRDGETGFVARSIEECISLLQMLLLSPEVREKISRNAIRHVAETRTPARSARDFMILWLGLLSEPKCIAISTPSSERARRTGFSRRSACPGRHGIGSSRRSAATTIEGYACAFRKRLCRRCVSCPPAAVTHRAPSSLRLQTDFPNDFAPQIVLRLHEGARCLGRLGAIGEEADVGKPLHHVRSLENLVHLLI